jgi:hypothetical protein
MLAPVVLRVSRQCTRSDSTRAARDAGTWPELLGPIRDSCAITADRQRELGVRADCRNAN